LQPAAAVVAEEVVAAMAVAVVAAAVLSVYILIVYKCLPAVLMKQYSTKFWFASLKL
jgi:hypothetical protein